MKSVPLVVCSDSVLSLTLVSRFSEDVLAELIVELWVSWSVDSIVIEGAIEELDLTLYVTVHSSPEHDSECELELLETVDTAVCSVCVLVNELVVVNTSLEHTSLEQ